ncbi:hypothetical protein SDC9_178795 [bioreactor metagenome]|uniref:Uncharacterized protein n=1 Tax=bioreactor metagenome TaxID=1076179 RepID=A0A645GWQ1_9ZZZZ
MVNTRCISNNQGWSGISLSLGNSFKGLIFISTHGDLCYIYIPIAHGDYAKIFLLGLFPAGRKLGNCRSRSGLRRLTAGIGIYFGIKHQNVYIFAGSQYMIQSAETNIIGPAVTAEYPLGSLY